MLRSTISLGIILAGGLYFAGCGGESDEAGDLGDSTAEQDLVAGSSDRYSCVTSTRPNCDETIGVRRSLEDAHECLEGIDFAVTTTDKHGGDPLVLVIHGGKIELGTAEIGDLLAENLGWDQYALRAAPKSSTCKEARWMHVTANRFNAETAVDMAKRHPSAVALHGYSEDNAERSWARESKLFVCVGGLNADARAAFIRSLNTPALSVGSQTVVAFDAVDASDATSDICGGLQGKGPTNIVNQPSAKGLQLEMPMRFRTELVGSSGRAPNAELRRRVTSAVESALGTGPARSSQP